MSYESPVWIYRNRSPQLLVATVLCLAGAAMTLIFPEPSKADPGYGWLIVYTGRAVFSFVALYSAWNYFTCRVEVQNSGLYVYIWGRRPFLVANDDLSYIREISRGDGESPPVFEIGARTGSFRLHVYGKEFARLKSEVEARVNANRTTVGQTLP